MKKLLTVLLLTLLTAACGDKAAETPKKASATKASTDSAYNLGTHYIQLRKPFAPEGGKNVVTEFFWYGCPHCQNFEPTLKKWETNKKPFNTVLKKVPAIWSEPLKLHAKLYYIAETMNIKAAAVHADLFNAVIAQRAEKDMTKQEAVYAEVFKKHGMDKATFESLLKSPKIEEKIKEAEALLKQGEVRSTPTVVVNGTYQIQNKAAKSLDEIMDIANHLIKQKK